MSDTGFYQRVVRLCLITAACVQVFMVTTASEAPNPVCKEPRQIGFRNACFWNQNTRLAVAPTQNNICNECGTPVLLSYRLCNRSVLHWECKPNPGIIVNCDTCSVNAPDTETPCVCQPPSGDCPSGSEWTFTTCECEETDPSEEEGGGHGSPILVSTRGNSLQLTSAADGVDFDIDVDGTTERLAWTAPGADDAFLVLDRNGNGLIDDGSELFGNYTEQPPSATTNGFLALAVFDDPANGGDNDGYITESDAVFSSLMFWTDQNHDGISQPSELASVEASRVHAFNLAYRASRRTDEHGNEFRYISTVQMEPARRTPRRKFAVDVFFVVP